MNLPKQLKDLTAENDQLRAAIQELTESRDKWANRAAEYRDDATRYIWAMPILSGDDNERANSRTLALGKALRSGKTGRELVDHAMKETP